MRSNAPLEHYLITHADMRRMKDGTTIYNQNHEAWVKDGPWWRHEDQRLLGTELKRLSEWLYTLKPFNPHSHIR